MKPRHSSTGSDEIMADIAETRASMDDTLDELSERLQPRHILDDLLDYFRSRPGRSRNAGRRIRGAAGKAAGQVKQKAGTAGRVAYQQVREHPLPALLIGAGVSLLLLQRNREEEYYEEGEYSTAEAGYTEGGYAEIETAEGVGPESYALPQHYTGEPSTGMMNKIKEKSHQLKEKAGSGFQHMKERTSETAGNLRRRASEKGAQWKEKAQYGYQHSRDAFVRTADERPLTVGLGCMALGVLAGMLLPSTRKEDEWVGHTRDRLVNRSREAAEDALERGKHVAQTAVETAKQEARQQGLTPDALKEKAQSMASHVKDATREEAQRQQQEFKHELNQS